MPGLHLKLQSEVYLDVNFNMSGCIFWQILQ
jgi:hypothetical protein